MRDPSPFAPVPLALRVGWLHIEIDVGDERVRHALRAAWRPAHELASSPSCPPTERKVHYRVDPTLVVSRDGEPLFQASAWHDVALHLSADIAQLTPVLHPDTWALHAASFLLDGRLFLLCGLSDAGKSTLSRAALQAGASYISDDVTLIREAELRGSPRTVQFNHVPRGQAHPHVADCDVTTYCFHHEGELRAIPLWSRQHPTLLSVAWGTLPQVVVHLRHGADEQLTHMSELERIHVLLEATLAPTHPRHLAQEFGRRRALRLTWNEPDSAIRALQGVSF